MMQQDHPLPHPVCAGRTVYSKASLEKLQQKDSHGILTGITNAEMAIVRANVTKIIQERQLSNAYFAAAVGVSKSQWSYWMSDPKRNLSVRAMLALSDLLGCSLHELVMGEKGCIRLPVRCALLYSVIRSQAALHALCDKHLAQLSAEPIETEKLIYLRLCERANDKNRPLRTILIQTSLEFVPAAKDFSAPDPIFKGRLPTFYGLCGLFDDHADFLARQDFSACKMSAAGRIVEPIYQKTIGKFASLSEDQQLAILSSLLHARYLK